jgi:hypothetical protein
MPRCFSSSIQSEVAWRAALRPLTVPAIWMAPPKSRSFSVSVVLPASGVGDDREGAHAHHPVGQDVAFTLVEPAVVAHPQAVLEDGPGPGVAIGAHLDLHDGIEVLLAHGAEAGGEGVGRRLMEPLTEFSPGLEPCAGPAAGPARPCASRRGCATGRPGGRWRPGGCPPARSGAPGRAACRWAGRCSRCWAATRPTARISADHELDLALQVRWQQATSSAWGSWRAAPACSGH